jgi:hypothetical protein
VGAGALGCERIRAYGRRKRHCWEDVLRLPSSGGSTSAALVSGAPRAAGGSPATRRRPSRSTSCATMLGAPSSSTQPQSSTAIVAAPPTYASAMTRRCSDAGRCETQPLTTPHHSERSTPNELLNCRAAPRRNASAGPKEPTSSLASSSSTQSQSGVTACTVCGCPRRACRRAAGHGAVAARAAAAYARQPASAAAAVRRVAPFEYPAPRAACSRSHA